MKLVRVAAIAFGGLIALSALPSEAMPTAALPGFTEAQGADVQLYPSGLGRLAGGERVGTI